MTHSSVEKHTPLSCHIVKCLECVWSCIIRFSSQTLLGSAVAVSPSHIFFSLSATMNHFILLPSPRRCRLWFGDLFVGIRRVGNIFWLVTSLLLTDVIDLHRCLFAATTDSVQRTPYYSVCLLSI